MRVPDLRSSKGCIKSVFQCFGFLYLRGFAFMSSCCAFYVYVLHPVVIWSEGGDGCLDGT